MIDCNQVEGIHYGRIPQGFRFVYGADHQSCTGGARITAEGGSLKRDLRAGSVCLSVCMSVRHATYCDVT